MKIELYMTNTTQHNTTPHNADTSEPILNISGFWSNEVMLHKAKRRVKETKIFA